MLEDRSIIDDKMHTGQVSPGQVNNPNSIGYDLIFPARVVDYMPHFHSYLIMSKNAATPQRAVVLTNTGLGMLDQREHGALQPDTVVLCLKPQNESIPLIVGVIPQAITPFEDLNEGQDDEHKFMLSDRVGPSLATGLKHEKLHTAAMNRDRNNSFHNVGHGRPKDTFAGEHGYMNAMGVGMNLGALSVMLRASELAQIQMFYPNNTVRVSAEGYQLWTAGRDYHSYRDGIENSEVDRYSPYTWESLGAYNPASPALSRSEEETDPRTFPDQHVDNVATQTDQQEGFYRLQKFKGYLGDLERTVVAAPDPTRIGGNDVETLASPADHLGLSETVRHANGLLTMRSLKGIILQKATYIPVPVRKKAYEDAEGDNASNYDYAGLEEHPKEEYEWQGEDEGPAHVAQLLDMFSWSFNAYGLTTLKKHENDYHLSSAENGIRSQFNSDVDTELFKGQQTDLNLPLPTNADLKVDHRGETEKYYAGKATVAVLDDGSIVLEDAYGSSIEMSGGNITFSCQGDMIMRPGRNLNVMAAHDATMLAGNCLELSSSHSDIRLKAERNLHMLAGNSGEGGMLLESRSTSLDQEYNNVYGDEVTSNGIVLLAKDSAVASLGRNVYLRSDQGGNLHLDAGGGNGDLYMYGRSTYLVNQNSFNVAFGVTAEYGGTPDSMEIHTRNSVLMDQPVVAMGGSQVLISGATVVDGYFNARNFVEEWQDTSEVIVNQLTSLKQQSISDTSEIVENDLSVSGPYGSDYGIGTAEVRDPIGFSFRTSESTQITEFRMYEARWQQLFKKTGQGSDTWEEPVVEAGDGTATRPFPGEANWTSSGGFKTIASTFYDPTAGDKTSLDDYDLASLSDFEDTQLESGYLVNLHKKT